MSLRFPREEAARLTLREIEILKKMAEGISSKQIAFECGITFKTACCHRAHILEKLQATNTVEAIRAAAGRGLIILPRSKESGDCFPHVRPANLEKLNDAIQGTRSQ